MASAAWRNQYLRWAMSLIGLTMLISIHHIFRNEGTDEISPEEITGEVLPNTSSWIELKMQQYVLAPSYKVEMLKPLCTFALFREHIRSQHYYPSGGSWNYSIPETPQYIPSICRFQYQRMTPEQVGECLIKSDVNYVVSSGDSTGQMNNAMLSKLSSREECEMINMEKIQDSGFMPDKNYFLINESWSQHIKVNRAECRECTSREFTCHVKGNTGRSKDVKFEHLRMIYVLDDFITLMPDAAGEAAGIPRIDTSQEYVYKFYIQKRLPDMYLILLPFNHEKKFPTAELQPRIERLHRLIRQYIPSSVKLFYIPAYAEFEKARSESVAKAWINKTFDGLVATEKINQLNHVFFNAVEPDILDTSTNSYGFLDLLEASRGHDHWSKDGIHMYPIWYEVAMDMFWQTYCNSVQLNAF